MANSNSQITVDLESTTPGIPALFAYAKDGAPASVVASVV